MTNIFKITTRQVQSLSDGQARELIARLCKAEFNENRLPQSVISWGGDQRAKDGGVDVCVDYDQRLSSPDFVLHQKSAFQVKAEKFSAGKIAAEIAPKGMIRPIINEYQSNGGGAYIIASTRDDCSNTMLQDRKTAIKKCFTDHGINEEVQSDFYDARRIADWIEKYPAIATWVREAINSPLKGWQPYAAWAYNENDVDTEYLIDDQVRVFTPSNENGLSSQLAISELRNALQRNVSLRIIGLSGVGKTRLVQALFDERIENTGEPLDRYNVIYTDLADEPEPRPSEMLEALIESGSDAVVIIDNCGSNPHQRLTEIAKRPKSNLKLLTVEYDIRDDVPEGTFVYRLEGASPEIIEKLVRKRYVTISTPDVRRISEFSDGNTRVAFALANTASGKGELSELKDAELFKRLFHQKNDANDSLLQAAEAASLLYSFDGEDSSNQSELAILSSIAGMDIRAFKRHMVELKRRGLLQQRNKWQAILPHAISNGLAKRALEFLSVDEAVQVLVINSSDRVARSFCRRVGYLHELPKSNEIAEALIKEGGRLHELECLNELEKQMFFNLAPVAQDATLEALERAVMINKFTSTDNRERSMFSRLARQLAYKPEHFERAFKILLKFALAEPENYNYDPAKSRLKYLFHSYLSGTHASIKQRVNVVKMLLGSDQKPEQKIGLELLEAGLVSGHFSSADTFEFGARKRDFGWQPKTANDVKSWYSAWIDLGMQIATSNSPIAGEVKTVIADAIRGLWCNAYMFDEIEHLTEKLGQPCGWPEGWLSLRRILYYDAKKMSEELVSRVKAMEQKLAPSGLEDLIRARVLATGVFAFDLDDEEFDDEAPASQKYKHGVLKAEELGKEASYNPELLKNLMPELLVRDNTGNIISFGKGVGKNFQKPDHLFELADPILRSADTSEMSVIFFRGVIAGWKEVDALAVNSFLDQAIHDKLWKQWFVEIQCAADLDTKAFERLTKLLDNSDTPTRQFAYLRLGRVTDPLTINQIFEFLSKLSQRKDNGVEEAFDTLCMVIHCTDKKDDDYKKELAAHIRQFLINLDWANINRDYGRTEHDLDVVLNFALKLTASENEVAVILQKIIEAENTENKRFYYDCGEILEPFFQYFPRLTLDIIYIPDENGSYTNANRMVSKNISERRESAIANVPKKMLLEWCDYAPEHRYTFAAKTCRLFDEFNEQTNEIRLSEVAKSVFANAPDKKLVLSIITERFRPSSWSGSLAGILEKRKPLLNEFVSEEDTSLNNEIETVKANFQKWIDTEKVREADDEHGRNASFE